MSYGGKWEEVEQRFRSHSMDDRSIEWMEQFREGFLQIATLVINGTVPSREQSLALTHLEEALFWANAGLARHGSER